MNKKDKEMIQNVIDELEEIKEQRIRTGKFVILNWASMDDISLAYNEDGTPMVFDDEKEATKYARKNFAWYWQVVQVE